MTDVKAVCNCHLHPDTVVHHHLHVFWWFMVRSGLQALNHQALWSILISQSHGVKHRSRIVYSPPRRLWILCLSIQPAPVPPLPTALMILAALSHPWLRGSYWLAHVGEQQTIYEPEPFRIMNTSSQVHPKCESIWGLFIVFRLAMQWQPISKDT